MLFKLKYDEANAALILLEAELTRMENNLTAMGDLDTKYQQAVRDKEEYLLSCGGYEAQHLFEMAEQLGCLKAEEKELIEALEAGREVEKAFSKVQKNLGSAQGWGAFDLLVGGFITTAIKHSHISDARNEIDQAQLLLRKFQRELADVKHTNDTIQIGGLAIFADFFLDGLLFDAIVQFKINDAQDRTKQLQRKVQAIIHDLNVMKEQNSQRILEIDQERRQIIENVK